MYGQSCRVVGRGGMGPLRLGGSSLCWGRSVTFHSHRQRGPQVPPWPGGCWRRRWRVISSSWLWRPLVSTF